MHPDDPPIPSLRGVARIMNSVDAFRKLLRINGSPRNGITLCQGNFTLMTDDLPSVIRELVPSGRVFFVHFRDVRGGSAADFEETFIDQGRTDMAECMRAYFDTGFSGIMRTDHTPPPFTVIVRASRATLYLAGCTQSATSRASLLPLRVQADRVHWTQLAKTKAWQEINRCRPDRRAVSRDGKFPEYTVSQERVAVTAQTRCPRTQGVWGSVSKRRQCAGHRSPGWNAGPDVKVQREPVDQHWGSTPFGTSSVHATLCILTDRRNLTYSLHKGVQ